MKSNQKSIIIVVLSILIKSNATTKNVLESPTSSLSSLSSSISSSVSSSSLESPNTIQCELYLAESTIPNAGLGIFSAVEKNIGDTIGNGDVCLPLFDIHWNNYDKEHENEYFSVLKDYLWDGRIMGMAMEVEGDDINAYWPGIDCAVNCHLALINVDKAIPEYDDGGLHRAFHPGAGAISPYHNGTTEVIRRIPKGGELFKFYGDTWFTSRFEIFGNIPLYHDYDKALYILQRVSRWKKKIQQSIYTTVILEIKDIWDSRTLNALPNNNSWEDALQAVAIQDIGEAIHQPHAIRSVEWLQEHGKCIDHIVPGRQSTIDGAGRGAFAKRDLPKGTIITGSPLHHIPDKSVFNIYDVQEEQEQQDDDDGERGEKKTTIKRSNNILGYQIMINYCFGHSESTLLLCPYGSGVAYMNHNKTLANVKIEWANHGSTRHNNTWLSIPPEEMMKEEKTTSSTTNLAFDFIATRDIQQGEELFIDYGDEWEQAWTKHVRDWHNDNNNYDYNGDDAPDRKERVKAYKSAFEYNKLYGNSILRTYKEVKKDPYPDNIGIHCHSYLVTNDYTKRKKHPNDPKLNWYLDDMGYPCTIIRRHEHKKVDNNDNDNENGNENEKKDQGKRREEEVMIMEDDISLLSEPKQPTYYYDVYIHHPAGDFERKHVHRRGLSFVDVPYSTDMHLLRAFRHSIGIPDHLMPNIWKNNNDNVKKKKKNNNKTMLARV